MIKRLISNILLSVIALTINNSTSQITGLSAEHYKAIKDLLSYPIESSVAYHSGTARRRNYLLDKRGSFPTGLLYLVEDYLWKNHINYKAQNRCIKPKTRLETLKASFRHTPRQEQIEASKAVLEQHRGIIVSPTGTGKSMIIALIIDELKVKTLVVVPSLELKRQLTETLSEIYGESNVGGASDNKAITVENVDALDYRKPAAYDCVIIDEFHKAGAKRYRKLNKKAWSDIYYRVGVTATPFRSNDNERLLLEGVLSNVIYSFSYADAVDKKRIVPMEPYFIEVPVTKTDAYSYGEAYSELVVNKIQRNRLICKLAATLHAMQQSSLVLVEQIEHGEILQEMLLYGFRIAVPFANGQDETSREMIEAFNNKEFPVLIGTEILGEGIDTRPCEWVILAGGTGKSKIRLMQRAGRAGRIFEGKESAKIVSFYEKSHKWFKKHHAFFIKIMKEEYGVTPVKLSID